MSREKDENRPIYIYLKIHNKTKKKYLGSTTCKNPYKYKGSGLVWKKHINKHGYNVTTKILGKFYDYNEAAKFAIKLSKQWNIVDNPNFANLMEENAQQSTPIKRFFSSTTKAKMSKSAKERMSNPNNNPIYGVGHTEETKKKVSETRIKKEIAKGHKNPRAKKVLINDIEFQCINYAAEYYNVDRKTVRYWCKLGTIPKGSNKGIKCTFITQKKLQNLKKAPKFRS